MYNLLKKISPLKIIHLFIILFLSVTAYALPSIEEFKRMCEDEEEIKQVNKLNLLLLQSNLQDRITWICNFDEIYNSPLVHAIYSHSLLLAKVIIEHSIRDGINYNNFTMKNGVSMLTLAAKHNNDKTVTFLLDNNHPIKMDSGVNFSSPIHESAKHQNTMIFIKLNEKCKNSNIIHYRNSEGCTPINYLINQQKEPLIIEILNTFPVDIKNTPKDFKNMTYLHHAVNNKMDKLTRLLLKQGLDPNQYSDIGTAFYIAEQNQYFDFINLTSQYHSINKTPKIKKNISFLKRILNCCGKDQDAYEPIL